MNHVWTQYSLLFFYITKMIENNFYEVILRLYYVFSPYSKYLQIYVLLFELYTIKRGLLSIFSHCACTVASFLNQSNWLAITSHTKVTNQYWRIWQTKQENVKSSGNWASFDIWLQRASETINFCIRLALKNGQTFLYGLKKKWSVSDLLGLILAMSEFLWM